jgi:putative oxidoreductase
MILSIHIRQMDAVLVARIFLGVLFFLQGFDKVFRVKISQVIETIHSPLQARGVPNFFSIVGAYFTSYVELICGTLLIIGFCKYYCMYLLGIDMVFVAIAFGVVEPMWDMRHIFPRLALLIFLLLVPSEWDVISVDYLWSLIKFIKSI